MKNIFKACIVMIFAFALCIPMQIIVKASTYTNMESKKDVLVNKPWIVSFNKPLSAISVNTENIKVVGEDNEYKEIKVSLTNSNKNVIIEPIENYEPFKTYTVIVTENVNCEDGKPLSKEVRMDFTTNNLPTKPSEFTVCIDPAQYYKAINGESGAKAKDINLSTALKLGNILKARGFNVVYTRDSDSVSWTESDEDAAKVAIVENIKADVFLSINTNVDPSNTAVNGVETYYVTDNSKNKLLATSIQGELLKATEANDRGIKEASNEATFQILKKLSCPSVILELGFLSNIEEETLLISQEYQNNAAKAIANGLMNYAGFVNTDINYDSIFTVSSVEDIMVDLEEGSQYIFPSTVQATMSNNMKKQVEVVWSSNLLDTSKIGVYTFLGTIKGSSQKASLVVNVLPVKKKYKVVLDAGHGGFDPGAVGPTGLKEKDVTLAITLKVGSILVKNGVETVYTRTTDNISWSTNQAQNLQARCDISNKANPDYFVSIHANSFSQPSPSGIETYYFTGNVAGQKLAQAVQNEIVKETGRIDRKIKTTSNFYVLKNVTATAILVETAFISNPEEEKLLATDAYQYKLAKAISTGILKSLGISNIVY